MKDGTRRQRTSAGKKRRGCSSYARTVLITFVKPRGMRTFVLGVSLAVGGFAGGIRAFAEGAGPFRGAALVALGAVGTAIALACVLEQSRR